MNKIGVCCPGGSRAVICAREILIQNGLYVTEKPDEYTQHLLLPVPSFPAANGFISDILDTFSKNVLISGGNLDNRFYGYQVVDFLEDPYYLAQNAAITSSCAIRILKDKSSTPLKNAKVLVVGWGRIGKCLSRLLEKEDADITIAARKASDRAMISALGCRPVTVDDAAEESMQYDIIINTVPAMVMPNISARTDCMILELASQAGISGTDIIDGRGLPNKIAPLESGMLIAQTFLRLSYGKEF